MRVLDKPLVIIADRHDKARYYCEQNDINPRSMWVIWLAPHQHGDRIAGYLLTREQVIVLDKPHDYLGCKLFERILRGEGNDREAFPVQEDAIRKHLSTVMNI